MGVKITSLTRASLLSAFFVCCISQDFCSSSPCGINGVCNPTALNDGYVCSCDIGYYVADTPTGSTCISGTEYFAPYTSGLVPPETTLTRRSSMNSFFRHVSVGYASFPWQPPSWYVNARWNWMNVAPNMLQPVRDQGTCKACTSFCTAAAMEAAYYLSSPGEFQSPLNISVQQFIDCGADSCSGSWIRNSFDYASRMYLTTGPTYPYTATEAPSNCSAFKLLQGRYGISMYERVSLPGSVGLILAVAQQPVVVAVEASSFNFLNYQGGIFQDTSCYSEGVDHTMLLVGYDLTSNPPHFVLRNSWGANWGENGYMRLAMTQGDGICGINVLPGLYPVIRRPWYWDPCGSQSFGARRGINQGRFNPCGGGTCSRTGITTYSCQCRSPFVKARSRDGTETCVPGSVCSFYGYNPCNVGTCMDSTVYPGNYTCVCPMGFVQGRIAEDNSPTCVAASRTQGALTYTVPANYNITCEVVYTVYGVSKTRFLLRNPNVNCQTVIPAGTVLNVTNDLGNCSIPYAVGQGESCDSISSMFLPEIGTQVYGAESPNPDLDCSTMNAGQLICLKRGNYVAESLVCSRLYNLRQNDTCESLVNTYFGGKYLQFYSINPGVYCNYIGTGSSQLGHLSSATTICLKSTAAGTILSGCSTGNVYTVRAADTCFSLISQTYGTSSMFRRLNGVPCTETLLVVGRRLCEP